MVFNMHLAKIFCNNTNLLVNFFTSLSENDHKDMNFAKMLIFIFTILT